MNPIEQEARDLCIAAEALDSFVNYGLLKVRDVLDYPGEAQVWFHGQPHQELFFIRALDSCRGGESRGSLLDLVVAAGETRAFEIDGSADRMRRWAQELRDWLHSTADVQMWLPALDANVSVALSRRDLLNILGNRVKHHVGRLSSVADSLVKALGRAGHLVVASQVILALDEVREHLQHNYFSYYATWLIERVNKVRCGIHYYLRPTYEAALYQRASPEGAYGYRFPPDLNDDVAREWFWRLMNGVRSKPIVREFEALRHLKVRSGIEAPLS
jgi:hypothetical protein